MSEFQDAFRILLVTKIGSSFFSRFFMRAFSEQHGTSFLNISQKRRKKVVSRTLDSVQNLISRLNLWLDILKSPQQNFLPFSGQLLASIIFLKLEGILVIIIWWKSMKIAHCVKITKNCLISSFYLLVHFESIWILLKDSYCVHFSIFGSFGSILGLFDILVHLRSVLVQFS